MVNDSTDPRVLRLWQLCYLDPPAARALGQQLAQAGGENAATGWLHVALADVRVGDAATSQAARLQAALRFAQLGSAQAQRYGLALCDEVQAIQLRRAGNQDESARLQAELDGRQDFARDAIFRFIAHNSRAITCKLRAQHDEGLRHAYASSAAADELGWQGPRITALTNLGGYHHDLFNLEDARQLSERALKLAREQGAKQTVGVAAVNLIAIAHASHEPQMAREMVAFLTQHPQELVPGMLDRFNLYLAMGHLTAGEIDAATAYLMQGAQSVPGDNNGIVAWTWLTARCLLARGDAPGARAALQQACDAQGQVLAGDTPYNQMEFYRVMADACEQLGDSSGALASLRRAQSLYENLVGRSARARYIALEVSHQLAQTQRERDVALVLRHSAEEDKQRLAELNTALQAKIEETQALHARLSEQALRDPLTGLHNRRYLFEVVPGMLELARRQNHGLCVVLLDLDHFKLLNDTFGHAAGDEVLKRFAQLLTLTLRRSDVLCRHGGEEFVAVMPDIDAAGAQAKIEQLLLAFQTPPAEAGRKRMPRASFSAGIAVFPRHGHSLEQLLLRADRGLYAAKNQGRARVEMAPKTGFGALSPS